LPVTFLYDSKLARPAAVAFQTSKLVLWHGETDRAAEDALRLGHRNGGIEIRGMSE
jgi:hypothetical protein